MRTCDCGSPLTSRRKHCSDRCRHRVKARYRVGTRKPYLGVGRVATAAERFAVKVQPDDDGCLIWIGAAVGRYNKYGRFGVDGKIWRAHRWAYEQARGPIPDGFELDHLCGHTLCVNVEHLEAVTPAENLRRQAARRPRIAA